MPKTNNIGLIAFAGSVLVKTIGANVAEMGS